MSNAGGVRAGKAFVEIGTDNNPLKRGLQKAQGLLKSWGAGLQSLGGAAFKPLALIGAGGLAGIAVASQQLADYGDQVQKAALRTGLSTAAVSELGHAASLSGSDFNTLELGLSRMQKLTSEAANGSKTAAAQLAELGLSAADLAGMTPDQQLEKFADAISALKDPADRVNAAMSIFGKSGQKLIPMLSGGAAGLQQMRDRAKELGVSMSQEDADAAAVLGDSIGDMKAAAQAAGKSLAIALAPALTTVFNTIANVTGGVANWIKQNRTLIVLGISAAAVLLGAAAAVYGLGAAFTVLSIAIGIAGGLLAGLGAALGFLVSTPGLIIVGLVALAGWFLYTSGIGTQALSWLGAAWQTLAGDATTAWGGIVAAIGAGDLQGAFTIAMAFLRLQWVRVTSFLGSHWSAAAAQLEGAWINTTTEMANAWSAFVSGLVGEFIRASDIITPLAASIAKKLGGDKLAFAFQAAGATAAGYGAATQGATDRAIVDRNAARDRRLADLQARGGSSGNSEVEAAQEALRLAVEAAKSKAQPKAAASVAGPDGALVAPDPKALKKGVQRAQGTAAAASDVRSQEGLKSLLAAFGGGGDPQQKIADNTKVAADEAVKQRVELERIRRNQETPADDEEPADLG